MISSSPMHLPTPVRGWRKSGRTMKMKRVITFGVLLAGLCAPPAVAQTSQRLLNSLSAGLGGLECGIAGPTVERLRRGDLLRSLEQGVGAIRSRHDSEDDGAPPSLRVVDGRPRIEPGGRLTLRRGSLLVDGIWDGLGPGDSTDDLLRDARRFLDAGIIDGDDDESIAVLERAVLTQAFAYAMNSRVAGLCGTTVGGAGGVVAGGVGGVRRPASSAGAVQPAVAVPALRARGGGLRRRSMARTWIGVGLMGGGFLSIAGGAASYDESYCDPYYDYYCDPYYEDRRTLSSVLVASGLAMMGIGALVATIWSDVAVERVALDVHVTRGGMMASRSFGW